MPRPIMIRNDQKVTGMLGAKSVTPAWVSRSLACTCNSVALKPSVA